MLDNISTGILKAVDVLNERGMAKGVFIRLEGGVWGSGEVGSVCVNGALGIVFHNDVMAAADLWEVESDPLVIAMNRITKYVNEKNPMGMGPISNPAEFNNQSTVTIDDMVKVMTDTANDPQYAIS